MAWSNFSTICDLYPSQESYRSIQRSRSERCYVLLPVSGSTLVGVQHANALHQSMRRQLPFSTAVLHKQKSTCLLGGWTVLMRWGHSFVGSQIQKLDTSLSQTRVRTPRHLRIIVQARSGAICFAANTSDAHHMIHQSLLNPCMPCTLLSQ